MKHELNSILISLKLTSSNSIVIVVEQSTVQHIALKLQWLDLVTVKACQTLINPASEPLYVMGGNMVNLEPHLESSGEKKLNRHQKQPKTQCKCKLVIVQSTLWRHYL